MEWYQRKQNAEWLTAHYPFPEQGTGESRAQHMKSHHEQVAA